MNCQGIVIEGVTGAGKTHTMKALLSNAFVRDHWSPCDVYREKETFGEFMGELLDHPDAPAAQKFRLLENSIATATARAQRRNPYRFIMERAHYSFYALLPDWDLYKGFDERLARLNSHAYLLWIPDDLLKSRSLWRQERHGWGEGFVDLYGSEAKAVNAIRSSQNARREAILRSAVPHTIIDTSGMEWVHYATRITAEMQHVADSIRRTSGRER